VKYLSLLAAICIVLTIAPSRTNGQPSPVTSGASARTVSVLNYLWNIRDDANAQILSGQYYSAANQTDGDYIAMVQDLQADTGEWVGILSASINNTYGTFGPWYGAHTDTGYTTFPRLYNHAKRGGVIMLFSAPRNPWNVGSQFNTAIGSKSDLYDSSTLAYKRYHAELNIWCDGLLKRLANSDIPVILVLLEEGTASNRWYGPSNYTNAEFITLFRHTVDYIKGKGLNNVLFCNEHSGSAYVDGRYPGNNYVDVIGFSAGFKQTSFSIANYDLAVAKGKVVGLTQLNTINYDMRGILTDAQSNGRFKELSFFSKWRSAPNELFGIIDNNFYIAALQDARMANRGNTGLGVSPIPAALTVPQVTTDLPETLQTGARAWNWNTDSAIEGWSTSASIPTIQSTNNRLHVFQSNSTNPFITSPNNLGLAAPSFFSVRMMNHSKATQFLLSWTKDGTTWFSRTFTISAVDQSWKTYTLDMTSVSNWSGTIQRIGLYPMSGAVYGSAELDYVRLYN
jgi:beta-mannanase